jgi:Protein of unknown function (DUF3617)
MSRHWAGIAGAGVAAGLFFVTGTANAETPLAVNPGLWEIVSQRDASGMPQIPPEALEGLPPEKRAQIEEAMKKQTKPHVNKACLTEEQLQRGFTLGDKESLKECKRTVLKSTSRVLDMRIECKGERTTVGDIHYEAVDPATMNATINMTMSDGQKTMTMKNVMHGKWLGADCGDVKPHEPHEE